MRYYVGEDGKVISADGILHGARYGMDVEKREDGTIVIEGEVYRPADDSEE